jgi:site-specific DNA recombinase
MKAYFAYIRVSTTKQGQYGSSLQEQRDAILSFAARSGFSITQWFEDRETAAKKGRTQFVRMMAALEKRKAAGVILHKIDRGARNLWDWARLQDLIDAGTEVHFVHDNLDLTSRGGRLAADIQAVVAADYVRNLRDEVRKGMRGRLKQGLYPWKAPIGYLDQGKAKAKIIDPVKGPLVKCAFELYATKQYSYGDLALELKRRGLLRTTGKPFGPNNMTAILRNPFYMGLIHIRRTGETFQGVHEPLISAELFQTVQVIRETKDNRKVQRHEALFRRLLKCGLCGITLIGEVQKDHTYYRCQTKGCPTTGVREEAVVAHLKALAARLPFTQLLFDELIPYLASDDSRAWEDQAKRLNDAKLRVAALEERQRRLTDAYVDQAIDRNAYDERKTALLMELAAAREAVQAAETPDTNDTRSFAHALLKAQGMLVVGPEDHDPAEYRDAVEKLTSNRLLIRKKLDFSLRSPFQQLIFDEPILFGAPARDSPRKRTGENTVAETGPLFDLGRQWGLSPRESYTRIVDVLARWADEVKLEVPVMVPERKVHPCWFKPKPTTLDGAA